MAESFMVTQAVSPEHVRAALGVRESAYSEHLGLSPGEFPDENLRDDEGYLFLLWNGPEVVGSARVLPTTSAHTELRLLGRLPIWAEYDGGMCEISRVAARPRDGGIPYSWIGLVLGAEWLMENTRLRRYIAYARSELVDLYQAVGAWETGVRFQIPDRGPTVYSVVAGGIEQAASSGAELLGMAPDGEKSVSLAVNDQGV
jgi:hypothetical protein